MERKLNELLKQHKAYFHYDGKVWCLSGITHDGNYWETDDYEADTTDQAVSDAIAYLESF